MIGDAAAVADLGYKDDAATPRRRGICHNFIWGSRKAGRRPKVRDGEAIGGPTMTGRTKRTVEAAEGSLDAAVERAEAALATLRQALQKGEIGEVGEKVASVATALTEEAEQLIEQNAALSRARKDITGAIRRHPLAAVGAAFGAGLLVALLVRG